MTAREMVKFKLQESVLEIGVQVQGLSPSLERIPKFMKPWKEQWWEKILTEDEKIKTRCNEIEHICLRRISCRSRESSLRTKAFLRSKNTLTEPMDMENSNLLRQVVDSRNCKPRAPHPTLLVDSDSTRLAVISKVLRQLGYNVMTARLALMHSASFRTKWSRLTLSWPRQGNLPDIDKYEFLEMLRKISELPVVIMTSRLVFDAFCIILEKKGEVDLILDDGNLPDVDKYEFLEMMGQVSKLPVVINNSRQLVYYALMEHVQGG